MGLTTPPREPIDLVGRAAARIVIVVVVALLASSCGGETPPSAPDLGAGREVDSTAAEATPAEALASIPEPAPSPTSTIVPPTPTDPPRPDPPMIGELVLPCGGAGDGADVGIDDESIVVGVGNDRGAPSVAGSGLGVVEAVRALADRCNALGGIAGRQIAVEELDAAVVEVEDRLTEACEGVFALVGHAYLDDTGGTTRFDCGLPAFPAWSHRTDDAATLSISALSATPVPVPLHGNFAALVASPLEAGRIALLGPDTPGAGDLRTRRAFALLSSGLPVEIMADVAYPIEVEPDWPALVSTVRRAGAGVVYLDGSCRSALVPFLQAAAEDDWDPAVIAGPEAYDPACIRDSQGVSFDRLLVETPLLPAEDGAAAPATADIVKLFGELGVPVTGDSLRAASAFWLWAVAADGCGSGLDRQCLVDEAASVEQWTAGGLHAASLPGAGTVEPCAIVLGVENGEYLRRLPAEPGTYDCEPLS